MDSKYSQHIKSILNYSREEAIRLGTPVIGTEHLLLGILRDGEGEAVEILKQLGADFKVMRKKIEESAINKIRMCHNEVKGVLAQINRNMDIKLKNEWQNLAYLESLLEKVSPQAIFKRGFSLVTNDNGKTISSIKQLTPNQTLYLTMSDGTTKVQTLNSNLYS